MNVKSLGCCGLVEANGLAGYTPAESIRNLIHAVGGKPSHVRSGVIFTSAYNKGGVAPYAETFKTYIEENNLGAVHHLPQFRNKNTGNYIKTYLWIVKPRNLSAWFQRNS